MKFRYPYYSTNEVSEADYERYVLPELRAYEGTIRSLVSGVVHDCVVHVYASRHRLCELVPHPTRSHCWIASVRTHVHDDARGYDVAVLGAASVGATLHEAFQKSLANFESDVKRLAKLP